MIENIFYQYGAIIFGYCTFKYNTLIRALELTFWQGIGFSGRYFKNAILHDYQNIQSQCLKSVLQNGFLPIELNRLILK